MTSESRDTGDANPIRVLKLRIPAQLVRAMDHVILSSKGAYLDRNEFVAEAIWDRVSEEGPALASSPPSTIPTAGSERPTEAEAATPSDPWPLEAATGHLSSVLPVLPIPGNNFGLHNRDLPTLWAVADLNLQTTHGPVDWRRYTDELRPRAQRAADWLRVLDSQSPGKLKASTGFPRTGPKSRSSEDRFLTTAVGTPRGATSQGPAFLLALVGVDASRPTVVAPTPAAQSLLSDLVAAGLSTTLPQPEAAARRWMWHVKEHAPDEYKAWQEVLAAVASRPNRADLINAFPQWPGSQADTNCSGFISRSREWGLVSPELKDGRYELTELGHRVASEGQD